MDSSSPDSCGSSGWRRRISRPAMREHGITSIDQVQLAVLETDGTISIVPRSSPMLRSHRGRSRTVRKR
jgi:YetF C-terminal domain